MLPEAVGFGEKCLVLGHAQVALPALEELLDPMAALAVASHCLVEWRVEHGSERDLLTLPSEIIESVVLRSQQVRDDNPTIIADLG